MEKLTDQEIELLAKKVAAGEASEEELILFVEEFNILLDKIKSEIKN